MPSATSPAVRTITSLTAAMSSRRSSKPWRLGKPADRQQAHPVEPALVGQRSVAAERGPAGPHGQHVVAEPGDRRVEVRAVATLDVGPNLAAETEPEPPPGDLGELPCRLRR